MYVDKLYIDNLDAFTEWGVFVERNGYRQVIQIAPFKKVDTTDWPEHDGIEADLSNPVFDARTLTVPFCITDVAMARNLFVKLSDGCYHTFNFVELGRSYVLRMTSNGSFSSLVKLGRLSLTFSEDDPSIPASSQSRTGSSSGGDDAASTSTSDVTQRGYVIDGTDLSSYGIWVLKGTDDSMRRAANTKNNLKIKTKNTSGVVYDGVESHWMSKDVTIRALINAPSMTEFWRRYNDFFRDLTQSGSRSVEVSGIDYAYEGFFKSMSVQRFEILNGGRVWCDFSVVMTLTGWIPVSSWYLLSTENDYLVLTEDGTSNIIIRV